MKITKLNNFYVQHDTFIGVDSDGCVFNSMERKQKDCFHPMFIKFWGLQAIAHEVREVLEFVTLYSKYRGMNRFHSQLKIIEFLRKKPEILSSGIPLPSFNTLQTMLKAGQILTPETISREASRTGDKELNTLLAWSNQVDQLVKDKVFGLPAFPGVKDMLKEMHSHSDIVVVSTTPTSIVEQEWEKMCLHDDVDFIAGMEYGPKYKILSQLTDKYPKGKALMIGDAPGDLSAAQKTGIHFYPIIPGNEISSWVKLSDEAYTKFLEGSFDETYQEALVSPFLKSLGMEK